MDEIRSQLPPGGLRPPQPGPAPVSGAAARNQEARPGQQPPGPGEDTWDTGAPPPHVFSTFDASSTLVHVHRALGHRLDTVPRQFRRQVQGSHLDQFRALQRRISRPPRKLNQVVVETVAEIQLEAH